MEQSLLRRLAGVSPAQSVRGRLAWRLAAAAIVISLAGVALRLVYAATTSDMSGILSHVALNPFLTVTYAIVGALVAARQPRNAIGWLFLTVGLLFALNIGAAASGDLAAILAREPLARPPLALWLDNWFWLPGVFLPTIFVFLLFPDGQLPSARWRFVSWCATLGLAGAVAALALHPGPIEAWGTGPNPYGIRAAAPALETLLAGASALLGAGFVGGIAAFALRYRRAQGLARKQMQWLLYSVAMLLVAHVGVTFAWFSYPDSPLIAELSIAVSGLTVLGIALAAAVAILRYRLYDIDLVVNRTLVYGALTASVVAIYVLVVGGLGWLFQARGSPLVALLATGLVAVLFQPLRERLQRAVNRVFYGQRDDPLGALGELGRQLESVIASDVVLHTLVETIAQTMKLPYVAIALHGGATTEVVTTKGSFSHPPSLRSDDFSRPTARAENVAATDALRLPLLYQGQMLGELLAAPRAAGEPFSPADRRLLQQIARQAGPAVHAVQLTAALQASRRQLVTAREEERRRLRRDLHDGLGAALAGLHLQAGVLRRQIGSDPQRAEALVDELRGDIRATIDEIRRLVYELRPPTLDQLGLAAAVRALAAGHSQPAQGAPGNGESALQVQVDAPEELPPLPAAVEVAAYRIVQEALTNVVHHAQARRCQVRLQINGGLQVEVVDDGVGLARRRDEPHGLGLLSMRERAAELGGTCRVEAAPGGGARVLAHLPLPQETPAPDQKG